MSSSVQTFTTLEEILAQPNNELLKPCTFKVEVVEIKTVTKHYNADRLECLTFNNYDWVVIAAKDENGNSRYKPGDKVVYVPIDSVLPSKLENYLFPIDSKIKLSKSRVKSIKIRGCVSQGMTIDLSEELFKLYPELRNARLGDDVTSILEITKYEPPIKELPSKMHARAKLHKNPYFKEYTDISNLKYYPDAFEGKDVYVSEKLHGCIQAKSLVTLANGDRLTIKDIVDNKLDVLLLGMDSKGNLIPTKILNYFNNGPAIKWLKIVFSRNGVGSGNSFGKLICTPIHPFYNPDKNQYIQAQNLKVGDAVLSTRQELEIPYLYKQILIGKMLGDGSLQGHAIHFGHTKEKEEYVTFVEKSLGSLCGNRDQYERTSGYGTTIIRSKTIASIQIKELFNNWFCKETKQVPNDIELSPISLAFWYMDDGSLAHDKNQEDRACFAICGFDDESTNNLVQALAKIGIEAVSYKSNNYNRLRLNSDAADKLFALIHPYIPICMQYKLPEYYRTGKSPNIVENEIKYKTNTKKQTILAIEEFNPAHMNNSEYDLETETHNYIANHVLVHNTSARYACLPKVPRTFREMFAYTQNLVPYFHIKMFGSATMRRNFALIGKEFFLTLRDKLLTPLGLLDKYEFCFGSRRVQLQEKAKDHKTFYDENVYAIVAEQLNLKERLEPGEVLYGEIIGSGIQSGYSYGCAQGEYKFFAYDVQINGHYLDYADFKDWCLAKNIPTVPKLYVGPWNKEHVDSLRIGDSLIGGQKIREGVVVKPIKETIDPRLGRLVLKYISDDYLTQKTELSDFH